MKHASYYLRNMIGLLLLLLIFLTAFGYSIDNDTWFLLATGRQIAEHGLFYQDVLSLHAGSAIVVQQWLFAYLLWQMYETFGMVGVFAVGAGFSLLAIFLFYRLSMLVSTKNRAVSLTLAVFVGLAFSPMVADRPHVVSICVFLTEIYLLELYLLKGKRLGLALLPLLATLLSNMHGALLPFFYGLFFPYFMEQLKPTKHKTSLFKRKAFWPIWFCFGGSLLAGCINPYGPKIFAYSAQAMMGLSPYTQEIQEMMPLSLSVLLRYPLIGFFSIILMVLLIKGYQKPRGIHRSRYLLLSLGTAVLFAFAIRSYTQFLFLGCFPLAFLYADKTPADIYEAFTRDGQDIFYSLCLLFFLFAQLVHYELVDLLNLESLRVSLFILGGTLVSLWISRWRQFSLKNKGKGSYLLVGTVSLMLFFLPAFFAVRYDFASVNPAYAKAFQVFTDYTKTMEKDSENQAIILYAGFMEGGYAEFLGYNPYIDARAEVHSFAINQSKDYWSEYNKVIRGQIPYREFIDSYGFTFLIVNTKDALYHNLATDPDFALLYEDSAYRVYHRTKATRPPVQKVIQEGKVINSMEKDCLAEK